MKKLFLFFIACVLIGTLSACSNAENSQQAPVSEQSTSSDESAASNTEAGVNALGAMSPEDALEYMKNTQNLVIVEVNAPEWKLSNGITGAMYILSLIHI